MDAVFLIAAWLVIVALIRLAVATIKVAFFATNSDSEND